VITRQISDDHPTHFGRSPDRFRTITRQISDDRAMFPSEFFAHRYQDRAYAALGSTGGEHVLVQNTAARAAAHNGSNTGLEPSRMRLKEVT